MTSFHMRITLVLPPFQSMKNSVYQKKVSCLGEPTKEAPTIFHAKVFDGPAIIHSLSTKQASTFEKHKCCCVASEYLISTPQLIYIYIYIYGWGLELEIISDIMTSILFAKTLECKFAKVCLTFMLLQGVIPPQNSPENPLKHIQMFLKHLYLLLINHFRC